LIDSLLAVLRKHFGISSDCSMGGSYREISLYPQDFIEISSCRAKLRLNDNHAFIPELIPGSVSEAISKAIFEPMNSSRSLKLKLEAKSWEN